MHKKSPIKMWRKQNARYGESRIAKLVAWSVVNAAPSEFEEMAPYIIGIVEFADKERYTTQIVDVAIVDLQRNMSLEPVFRKVYSDGATGVINYAVKYRPLQ